MIDNASEFNPVLLADLIIRGYKHILYISKEDHAILKPLMAPIPDELATSLGAYQIGISENEVINMAGGDTVGGFKFYVATDLFEYN